MSDYIKTVTKQDQGCVQLYEYNVKRTKINSNGLKGFNRHNHDPIKNDNNRLQRQSKHQGSSRKGSDRYQLKREKSQIKHRDTNNKQPGQSCYIQCYNFPCQISMKGILILTKGFDVKRVRMIANCSSSEAQQFLNLRLYFQLLKQAQRFKERFQGCLINGSFKIELEIVCQRNDQF